MAFLCSPHLRVLPDAPSQGLASSHVGCLSDAEPATGETGMGGWAARSLSWGLHLHLGAALGPSALVLA